MAQFVSLLSLQEEKKASTTKPEVTPTSLANLDRFAAQIWDEPKKSRKVAMDLAVRDKLSEFAVRLDISVSELLERIGRGVYVLSDDSEIADADAESGAVPAAPEMPKTKTIRVHVSLTDTGWDGFRKVCKRRGIRPIGRLLWLIANEAILVGLPELPESQAE